MSHGAKNPKYAIVLLEDSLSCTTVNGKLNVFVSREDAENYLAKNTFKDDVKILKVFVNKW